MPATDAESVSMSSASESGGRTRGEKKRLEAEKDEATRWDASTTSYSYKGIRFMIRADKAHYLLEEGREELDIRSSKNARQMAVLVSEAEKVYKRNLDTLNQTIKNQQGSFTRAGQDVPKDMADSHAKMIQDAKQNHDAALKQINTGNELIPKANQFSRVEYLAFVDWGKKEAVEADDMEEEEEGEEGRERIREGVDLTFEPLSNIDTEDDIRLAAGFHGINFLRHHEDVEVGTIILNPALYGDQEFGQEGRVGNVILPLSVEDNHWSRYEIDVGDRLGRAHPENDGGDSDPEAENDYDALKDLKSARGRVMTARRSTSSHSQSQQQQQQQQQQQAAEKSKKAAEKSKKAASKKGK